MGRRTLSGVVWFLGKKEVFKKLSAPGCLLGAAGRSCWWRETEREKEMEGRIDIYSA